MKYSIRIPSVLLESAPAPWFTPGKENSFQSRKVVLHPGVCSIILFPKNPLVLSEDKLRRKWELFCICCKKKKKFAKAALKERWLHWCDVVLVSRAGISQLLCNFWDELSRNSHFLIVEPPSPCCCHTQDALRCLGHFLMKKSDLIWWLPSFLSSIKLSSLLFPHPDFYCTP